ncbi:carbon-nitrogen hydrolase family protein [Pseudomonas sp. RC10]|uniref:carbon-nitrogen hydrolase family protein n=1 Tax=Pseudomonas bambusae TaxID=3139142 RepID=UPI003139401D
MNMSASQHSPFPAEFTAAVVQAAPGFCDLQLSVEKTLHYIAEAARQGASIVAFPEDWIPGYPWWIWLDAPAWGFSKGWVRRFYENAFTYESEGARLIAAAARQHKIHVSLGVVERIGASLYVGNWIIDDSGESVSRRRKLKPTHMERTVFGEGDGSDLVVSETPLGRIGALSCWEHLQPLTKFAMYSQNEQLHVAAWPGFSLYKDVAYSLSAEASLAATQTYALEGGCFVLAPSSVTSQSMVDQICDAPEKHALFTTGGGHSVIYGPYGNLISERMPDTWEGVICAPIDLGEIAVAKAAADPAGHYARPDVMRLLLNRTPAHRVHAFEPGLQEQRGPFPAAEGAVASAHATTEWSSTEDVEG